MPPTHAHFDVVRADPPGPVVVEVPHAGLEIDPTSGIFTMVPREAERADALRADADLGADAIWAGSEARGVTRVVARTHRYVIDLNTDPRPGPVPPFYQEDPAPRPTIRRSAAGPSWLEPALPREEVARRVREIFDAYHDAIDRELERSRERHGRAVLVASHTFPEGLGVSADVVVGTAEGQTLEVELRDVIVDVLRAAGLTVAIEAPFPGGFSITRHARLAEGVGAVQLELARRLVVEPGRSRMVSDSAIARLAPVADAVATAVAERIGPGRARP